MTFEERLQHEMVTISTQKKRAQNKQYEQTKILKTNHYIYLKKLQAYRRLEKRGTQRRKKSS